LSAAKPGTISTYAEAKDPDFASLNPGYERRQCGHDRSAATRPSIMLVQALPGVK
jgi:hypothetical protein